MNHAETLIDDLVKSLDEDLGLGLQASWIRSSLSKGIQPEEGQAGVDRNTQTIHGVAVVTKGEALGHNRLLDETFLEQTVNAGNKARHGVKARFDHPNASNTSMGTTVGRFKQFRRDGDIVRADLHFLKSASKSPNGDYPDYIMSLAEEDPGTFGTSIVFEEDEPLVQLDEEGKPIEGALMISRLKKLFAADVVDEPAANPNGFFSTPVQQSLATKLTQFLDKWFERKGLSLQVNDHNPKGGIQHMDPKATQLKDQAVENDTKAFSQEDLVNERKRTQGLIKRAQKFGCSDEFIEQLLDDNVSMEVAYERIMDDAETRKFTAKHTVLGLMDSEANPSAGGAVEVPEDPKPNLEQMSIEDRCQHEWKADKAIREEFGTVETYMAFKQNEGQSRRLLGGRQDNNGEA